MVSNTLVTSMLNLFGEQYIEDIKLAAFYLTYKLNTTLVDNPMSGFKKRIGDVEVTLINGIEVCSELNMFITHKLYEGTQFLCIRLYKGKNSIAGMYYTVLLRKYKDKFTVTLTLGKDKLVFGSGKDNGEFNMAFSLMENIPRSNPEMSIGESYGIV